MTKPRIGIGIGIGIASRRWMLNYPIWGTVCCPKHISAREQAAVSCPPLPFFARTPSPLCARQPNHPPLYPPTHAPKGVGQG